MMRNQKCNISVQPFALHLRCTCVGIKTQHNVKKAHSILIKGFNVSISIEEGGGGGGVRGLDNADGE